MDISLICMDIDGTLVNDKHLVPKENVEALREAAKKGIKLALISGRYPQGIRYVEKQIGAECIKAAYAGGYIFDDSCLYSEYLSTELAFQIYDTAVGAGGDCWFFSGEKWYVTKINPWVETEIENVSSRPEIISIEGLDGIFRQTGTAPNKVLVTGSPQIVEKIYQILKPLSLNVRLAFSSPVYLEVTPTGIHKGFALEKLCEIYKIPIQNTVAFGDQELDIPLLEKAGVGIAVANGVELLKNKADFITKSNNEGGVAYALRNILNII